MTITQINKYFKRFLALPNLGLVMLWIAITSAGPFLFNVIKGHPHQLIIIPILIVMVSILLIRRKILIGDRNVLIILFIQLIFFVLLTLHYNDNYYLTNVALIIGLGVMYVFIVSVIGIDKTISSILIVMVVMGALGILAFFLAITGILEPSVLYYRSETEPVFSFIITFTNTIFSIGNGWLIRVGGFFNEGGTLGFYLVHALILNKLTSDNKKIEFLLFFSGLFTFSFAFYIALLIYFMFFYMNRKSMRYVFGVFFIIFVVFMVVNFYKNENVLADYIYDLVFRRFELDADYGLKGNNRAVFIAKALQPFFDKPLFGYGIEYVMNEMPVSNATFMGPLVAYGLIGTFIYFLHVMYLCIIAFFKKSGNSILIKSVFILLLNYLQRPFVMSLYSYLFIILLSEAFRRQKSQVRTAYEKNALLPDGLS